MTLRGRCLPYCRPSTALTPPTICACQGTIMSPAFRRLSAWWQGGHLEAVEHAQPLHHRTLMAHLAVNFWFPFLASGPSRRSKAPTAPRASQRKGLLTSPSVSNLLSGCHLHVADWPPTCSEEQQTGSSTLHHLAKTRPPGIFHQGQRSQPDHSVPAAWFWFRIWGVGVGPTLNLNAEWCMPSGCACPEHVVGHAAGGHGGYVQACPRGCEDGAGSQL